MVYYFVLKGQLFESNLQVVIDGAGKGHIIAVNLDNNTCSAIEQWRIVDNPSVKIYQDMLEADVARNNSLDNHC